MSGRVELKERFVESLLNFDAVAVRDQVGEALKGGWTAGEVIEVLRGGLEVIGEKYRSGEFFVTDLILAGEVMKEAQEVLEPSMRGNPIGEIGTAVVATVSGDVHDIGKNIFVMLMRAEGFRVIDLGVDVPVEKIVDAVREQRPNILGLSAMLTTNLEEFPKIVEALRREGLRDGVKVLIGGATVTGQFAVESGVDAYAKSAVEGISLSRSWVIP